MFGSVVLDVSIGMVFIYLLMSLIASVVQEIISAYLQLRSANLLRGIRSLFSGDSLFGRDLVSTLYSHGLIRGLYSDPAYDEVPKSAPAAASLAGAHEAAGNLWRELRDARTAVVAAFQEAKRAEAALTPGAPTPDQVEAYNRARATVATASMQAMNLAQQHRVKQAFVKAWAMVEAQQGFWRGVVRWLIRVPKTVAPAGTSNAALLPAYIPARTFGVAMLDILNVSKVAGDGAMLSITQSLAEHHWQWQGNKAGHALYALALNADGDLKVFQASLEQWYNDSMDRASGWYKRYTQRILLVLGLVLALFFNVDSVKVARTLWFDRDTRQAMVDAASAYAKDPAHKDAPQTAQPPSTALQASETNPTGAAIPSGTASPPEAGALKAKLTEAAEAFKKVTGDALLPVGWKVTPLEYLLRAEHILWPPRGQAPRDWSRIQNDAWRCFTRAMGWLVTGIAISLGAPFWFDLLNKFMVVRSTVKPQEKSRTDNSKD